MEHCLHMILDFATAQESLDDGGNYSNYSTITGDHGEDHFHFLKTLELRKKSMQIVVKQHTSIDNLSQYCFHNPDKPVSFTITKRNAEEMELRENGLKHKSVINPSGAIKQWILGCKFTSFTGMIKWMSIEVARTHFMKMSAVHCFSCSRVAIDTTWCHGA